MTSILQGLLYRTGLRSEVKWNGRKFTTAQDGINAEHSWLLRNQRYELPELLLSKQTFDPTRPTIELGAGMGILSCFLAPQGKEPGYLAVEMDWRAANIAESNRCLNNQEFEIRRAAISYSADKVSNSRGVSGHFDMGNHAVPGNDIPTTTLRKLIAEKRWSEINLLMDIEGMEAEVIKHDLDVLMDHVKCLVFEAHPDVVKDIWFLIRTLEAHGFQNCGWNAQVLAFYNRRLCL